MEILNNFGLVLIIVIMLLYIVIGIYPINNSSLEKFLISGRDLGPIDNGFSIAASKIGGGLLVTYSILFFTYGWPAFFYFIGIIIGYIFFYRIAVKIRNESSTNKYYTLADYFYKHYNFPLGIVVGLLTILSVFGWVITNLIAGSALIASMTGLNLIYISLSLALVVAFYLLKGGFHAVVRTDKIQYSALILIGLVFLFLLFSNTTESINWFPTTGFPIAAVIGFLVLGIFFPMGSAELWQRVYASKDVKALKGSIFIASISYIVLGLVISIICLIIMGAFHFFAFMS